MERAILDVNGGMGGKEICGIRFSANTAYGTEDNSHAVRPIVCLERGILDGKTETGLRDDPIVLD